MKKRQKILDLKPTQFAVGVLEIEEKIAEMSRMKASQLRKLVNQTPIPVVVSPWGELYLVDHHHFLFAAWAVGVKKVKVKVVEDISKRKMTEGQFWKFMGKHDYFYPYCQFGEGPRNALYLPQDIRGLGDDPYRSLAWFVRHEKGYENSSKTFAEFQWANFFRAKKLLDRHGRKGFDQAVKRAVRLARSKAARKLPGFLAEGSSA